MPFTNQKPGGHLHRRWDRSTIDIDWTCSILMREFEGYLRFTVCFPTQKHFYWLSPHLQPIPIFPTKPSILAAENHNPHSFWVNLSHRPMSQLGCSQDPDSKGKFVRWRGNILSIYNFWEFFFYNWVGQPHFVGIMYIQIHLKLDMNMIVLGFKQHVEGS